MRDYSALKEKLKTNLEGSVRSRSDLSGYKDHTYQFALQCAIAFVCTIYRNDLILADFYLAAGWLIRQTAKFNSPPTFSGYLWYYYTLPTLGDRKQFRSDKADSKGAWQLHWCACVDYGYYWLWSSPRIIDIYACIHALKGLGMRLIQLQIAQSIGEPSEKVVRPEP